jgi:hypothetical protein
MQPYLICTNIQESLGVVGIEPSLEAVEIAIAAIMERGVYTRDEIEVVLDDPVTERAKFRYGLEITRSCELAALTNWRKRQRDMLGGLVQKDCLVAIRDAPVGQGHIGCFVPGGDGDAALLPGGSLAHWPKRGGQLLQFIGGFHIFDEAQAFGLIRESFSVFAPADAGFFDAEEVVILSGPDLLPTAEAESWPLCHYSDYVVPPLLADVLHPRFGVETRWKFMCNCRGNKIASTVQLIQPGQIPAGAPAFVGQMLSSKTVEIGDIGILYLYRDHDGTLKGWPQT